MKLSMIGRISKAIVASTAVLLGMSACGGGTVGFMWVLAGKQTANGSGNNISGFKIDDFTGNLTAMVGSPYTSGGVNPNMLVVKPGGRFVYVVNSGDNTTSGNVAQFSVGGDGVLTFQQSYTTQGGVGSHPVWIQFDSSGSYLFVLDTQAPLSAGQTIPAGCTVANCGAVSVYQVAADTGRLTLVTNTTIKNNATGAFITYFPTGPVPTTMKTFSSTLLIANSDQTITSYSANPTTGQLTLTTSGGTQNIGATKITSITGPGAYVYVTDGGVVGGVPVNTVLAYTLSNGVLQPVTGANGFNSPAPGATPDWTLTESKGKFVYVVNYTSTSSTTPASSISVFNIDANGRLSPISGTTNPFPVGANPVCMVEDPSNKYVYTSNQDGTVTGFEVNQTTGELNQLRRGSTFQVSGKPSCLAVSGNTQ